MNIKLQKGNNGGSKWQVQNTKNGSKERKLLFDLLNPNKLFSKTCTISMANKGMKCETCELRKFQVL